MINTTVLANGVHILSQRLPGHRSVAVGLWLLNGARHETPQQAGYAHFLEHLFFKGTDKLGAAALALRLEAIGGQINAHTGRELTALHGLVARDDVGDLLDILIDMLCRPRFDDADVNLEREVILQEMAMIEDNPEEALEDRAMALAWPDHPLGTPVLGRAETVRAADAACLRDYLRRQISGGRVWLVAAGDIEHEALVTRCQGLSALRTGTAPPPAAPRFRPGEHRLALPAEQAQLLWVMPVPPAAAASYYPLLVANHLLGGGASSRLFQALRERLGWVYGVHSRLDFYSDSGVWLIQTACDPRRAAACADAVAETIDHLLIEGPDPQELDIARRHLGASLIIDEDHSDSVMERLAREAVYLGRHPDFQERVQQFEAVDRGVVTGVLASAWERRLFARTA
jgi:predicted Zn-dependent peptidase